MINTNSHIKTILSIQKNPSETEYKLNNAKDGHRKTVATLLTIGAIVLTIAGIALVITALAAAIIPLVICLVGASLLVAGIACVITLTSNKKTYEAFMHVIGMTATRITAKEGNLENCNLIHNTPGAKKEDLTKPSQYANTLFVTKDGHSLTLMGTPKQANVEWLDEHGYRSIVAMQEKWEQNGASLGFKTARPYKVMPISGQNLRSGIFRDSKNPGKELSIRQKLISTPDRKGVSPEDLDCAVECVDRGLKVGHVAVHCKSGVGRSAKVCASYLHKYEGMDIETAINTVKAGRKIVVLHQQNSITHMYEYAFFLLNEKANSSDADLLEIKEEIITLQKQIEDHLEHYELQHNHNRRLKLENKLHTLLRQSGLLKHLKASQKHKVRNT